MKLGGKVNMKLLASAWKLNPGHLALQFDELPVDN